MVAVARTRSNAPLGTLVGMQWQDTIQWDRDGLVPVIAQESHSGDILMFAYMNRQALQRTVELGQAVYWSRSRQRLWHKGEESGHFQQVHDIRLDCDGDVLLLTVTQLGHDPGIACHTGRHSCFFRRLQADRWIEAEPVLQDPATIYRAQGGAGHAPGSPSPAAATASNAGSDSATSQDLLARLAEVIESRRPQAGGDPEKSYVARLFAKGTDAILKKVGEEATETVMAAKDGEPQKIVYEVADLWFHTMVALAAFGLKPADVLTELARREGLSGLEEFALRRVLEREREQS
jgi:phosphoribosyl-ATP pyrophosphohydrolase/phosphoribosyl-AMP cyclohydrolase